MLRVDIFNVGDDVRLEKLPQSFVLAAQQFEEKTEQSRGFKQILVA